METITFSNKELKGICLAVVDAFNQAPIYSDKAVIYCHLMNKLESYYNKVKDINIKIEI